MDPDKNCTLIRRLAAIFYDSLLLTAVFFFCTLILLPITHGKAITSGNILFELYLILISYFYFAWQWTHGGQTLGMRAWKIRVEEFYSQKVSWKSASLRFFLASVSWVILGTGFLWSLIDREKLALHDRYSQTRLIITR